MQHYLSMAVSLAALLLYMSVSFAADAEAAGAAPSNEAAAEAPATQVLVTVACGPKSPCNAKNLLLTAGKTVGAVHGFVAVTAGDVAGMAKPGDTRSPGLKARAMGIVNHLNIRVTAGRGGLAKVDLSLTTGDKTPVPRLISDDMVRAKGGVAPFVKKAIGTLLQNYAELRGRRLPAKMYGAVSLPAVAINVKASLTKVAQQAIQEAVTAEVLTLAELRNKLPAESRSDLENCDAYPCQAALAASFGVTDILDISVEKGTKRGMVFVTVAYRSGKYVTARVRSQVKNTVKDITKAMYAGLAAVFPS